MGRGMVRPIRKRRGGDRGGGAPHRLTAGQIDMRQTRPVQPVVLQNLHCRPPDKSLAAALQLTNSPELYHFVTRLMLYCVTTSISALLLGTSFPVAS